MDGVGLDVSRRSTNAVFCVWALFVSCLQLALIDYILQRTNRGIPPIMEAVNNHGFFMFVIANLMTGLVNISINTLEVPDGTALVILGVYMSAVSAVSMALESSSAD